MSKLFIYDLETTGVEHWKHGIHQISFMPVIDGEVKGRYNYNVRPFATDEINPMALEVCEVTTKQIMAYPEPYEVFCTIRKVLERFVSKFDKKDKFHLVGYNNATFDNQFFRQFFLKNEDMYFGSYFWADTIDVMVLASHKLMHKRAQMENFQLKTVAKEFGITVDHSKLHDALYDLELTKQVYENCLI